MDENLAEFTCIRKTVRWPLLIFYNILDVASNNTFIHMKRSGYTKAKKEFLRALSLEMASPYAKNRHRVNTDFTTRFVMPVNNSIFVLFQLLVRTLCINSDDASDVPRCHGALVTVLCDLFAERIKW